jgi:hypothetical protein
MIRKVLLCAVLGMGASFALEAEVTGELKISGYSEFDSNFEPTNYSGHHLGLGVKIGLDEGVGLNVLLESRLTSNSDEVKGYNYPGSLYGHSETSSYYGSLKSPFEFPVLNLEYEILKGAKVFLGGYRYFGAGVNSLDLFKDAYAFSPSFTSSHINGISLEASDFTLAVGLPAGHSYALTVFAEYDFLMINKKRETARIIPQVELNYNTSRKRMWNANLEIDYTRYFNEIRTDIRAVGSWVDSPMGEDNVKSWIVEPTIGWGIIGLELGYFHRIDGDYDLDGETLSPETSLPVDMFLSATPLVRLHPKVALEAGYWYVTPTEKANEEFQAFVPAINFYPTVDSEVKWSIGVKNEAPYTKKVGDWFTSLSAEVTF